MSNRDSVQNVTVALLVMITTCVATACSGGEVPGASETSAGSEQATQAAPEQLASAGSSEAAPSVPATPVSAVTPAPATAAPPASADVKASQPAAPAITPVDPTTAPQPVPIAVPKAIQKIVDAGDRDEGDRALDAGRHPGEMLTFFGVKPGMKVADLFAATGYTTELLARTVGSKGIVYGQNSQYVIEKFVAGPWAERLAKPVNKNVVRVDQELDNPLPAQAKNLDAVFFVLGYHDSFWLQADRDKMNKAVFDALKPGGVYAVIDHSGRTGSGSSEILALHRIEQSVVQQEIERAGFKLDSEAFFLRNPDDARDWNDSPMTAGPRRGTSDRFVLKFVKPK